MLVDPNGLFEAILRGLERLPYALIAVVLLGGPTAVWIIARFINPPDSATPEYMGLETLLWVCPKCRSLNEDRLEACYACHRLRPAEDTGRFEPAHRDVPGVGVPVGPGRPSQPVPASWLGGDIRGATGLDYDEGEPEEDLAPDEEVDVFEPRVVEPVMKVSRRPSGSAPAKRPRSPKKPTADGAGKAVREPAPKSTRKRRAS
jgi:hypothetical protein